MRERAAVLPVLLLALTIVSGCGAVRGYAARGAPMADAAVAAESADGLAANASVGRAIAAPDGLVAVADGDAGSPRAVPAEGERLLIYDGRFSIAVPSVDEAIEGARRMADRLGGWVQAQRDDTVVLRVPAHRWEESLAGLRDLGRVLSRQIEARDVTEDVVDLRLRLKNARALRQRLEELLAEADTVEVTLKVEAELNRVRTEIESLQGKLRVLENRVAFSTLTIRFVPVDRAPTRLQALPFPWLRELGLEGLLGLSGGVR